MSTEERNQVISSCPELQAAPPPPTTQRSRQPSIIKDSVSNMISISFHK